jgi:hypothetical protein
MREVDWFSVVVHEARIECSALPGLEGFPRFHGFGFRQHLRTGVQILHRILAHGGGASVETEGEDGIEVITSTLEVEMLL